MRIVKNEKIINNIEEEIMMSNEFEKIILVCFMVTVFYFILRCSLRSLDSYKVEGSDSESIKFRSSSDQQNYRRSLML